MSKKWIRTMLSAVLTLAMVLTVMGAFGGERLAKAAVADATISPSTKSVAQGETGTVSAGVTATDADGGTSLTYAWSVASGSFVSIPGAANAANASISYDATSASAGDTATVQCVITDTTATGAGATATKTISITVAAAPAALPPLKAPPASAPTSITGGIAATDGTYNLTPNSGATVRFKADPTGGDGNYTYEWSVKSGSGVVEKYAPVTADGRTYDFKVIGYGDFEVQCVVTDGAGSTNTFSSGVKNNAIASSSTQFYISKEPSSPMYVGDRFDLEFVNTTGTGVTVTSDNNSVIQIIGNQLCADNEGTVTIIAKTGSGMTDSFTVTVQRRDPAIIWYANPDYAARDSMYTLANNINKARSDYDTSAKVTWTLTSVPAGATDYAFSASAGTLSFGNNATLGDYVVTMNIGATTKYRAASPSFTIKLNSTTAMNVSPSKIDWPLVGLSQTVTVVTNPAPTSADSLVVTATTSRTDGNPVVGIGPITQTATGYYFTVTGMTEGSANVRVRDAKSGNSVIIPVNAGNPTGNMTVTYSPNVTELGKGGYTYAYVHVDNPQSNYVKLTRSNTRVYAEGYNYSHPSTNTYYSTLDASGNATFLIRPQYTGSVTLDFENGSATSSRTFYVSGYPTMPQTGPNYTPIYIVSGLCLALVATAVTLNARKKRKDEQSN